MKKMIILIFLLSLLSGFKNLKDEKTIQIGIIYTNNTNGILENCGCPGNPVGGLDKRFTLIKKLKEQTNNLSLVLDAGDIFSSIGFVEKDKFVLQAYKILPYDAIGIGDQEFSSGISFFEEIKKNIGDKLISANIKYKNGKLIARKFIIKEIGGIKFGITSIISDDPFAVLPNQKIKEIEIEDYLKVLEEIIPYLKSKADIIILLSHLGYVKDIGIASKFPDIDIIIGAHSQTLLREPEIHNKTIILQAGKDGGHVGFLKISVGISDKKILNFSGDLYPLLKDIKGDPSISSILKAYQKFVSFGFKDTCLYSTPIPSNYIVVDNNVCMNCHEEIGYKWMFTAHAHAFRTIIEDGRINDPECLSCHTTGYCRVDGFSRKPYKKNLLNVGCVECHFTKKEHIDGNYEGTVEPVTADVCVRCHNEDRDPHFDFEKYVLKVNHLESEIDIYIVKNGDCLWNISKKFYSDPLKWKIIYEINKSSINNPNIIYPEQKIKIMVKNAKSEKDNGHQR